MIDELNLIKEILGDLTGVGIWGFIAFLGYGLIKFIASWGTIFYIANKVITMWFDYIKCPVSKEEYIATKKSLEEVREDIGNQRRQLSTELVKAQNETDRVKHMYKIMKEANDGPATGS